MCPRPTRHGETCGILGSLPWSATASHHPGDQMDTHLFERSAATFRAVLVGVHADQLDNPTPCVPLNVARLIEKAIGHQNWVRGALQGLQAAPDYPRLDPDDYVAAFDRSTAAMLDELQTEGAATRIVPLAAGLSFAGCDVMIL